MLNFANQTKDSAQRAERIHFELAPMSVPTRNSAQGENIQPTSKALRTPVLYRTYRPNLGR